MSSPAIIHGTFSVKKIWDGQTRFSHTGGGRGVWISDGGSTMHMVADGTGMYGCVLPPVENLK